MRDSQTGGVPPAQGGLPWYDSKWLSAYIHAKAILRRVGPAILNDFVSQMRVFRTRMDFQPTHCESVFSEETLNLVRQEVVSMKPSDLELHEARLFGRFVVHDRPRFSDLQRQLEDMVSRAAGEPVESSYNFLSRYTRRGVCRVHLDAPIAKWTLDICVRQSVEWPIYFSQVVPWPESEDLLLSSDDWETDIRCSSMLNFRSYVLQPGQAVLFSGSSQWHYRDPIPGGVNEYCDLLFFHYIPRGTSDLVQPASWARIFGVPELAELRQFSR